MANKVIDKHYLLESLKDFNNTILLDYFQKKLTVNTVPSDPVNGDIIIYVGATSGNFVQGHTYKYNSIPGEWVDITDTGAGSWGSISDNPPLSNQTDLQNALDNKYDIKDTISNSIGLNDYLPIKQTDYIPTWETMTWSGLTNFYGSNVWTDGADIYYSYGLNQYKLNGTTWEIMTWTGFTNFYGVFIWTDGTNIYYSNGSSDQYKLNGTTWVTMTWTGRTNFYGDYVWTDGTNIYYSSGLIQCKLNGTTWETVTWTGLTNFYSSDIWTDGINTYYSKGSDQYKLNGTTWETMTWSGMTNFSGSNIWTDGNNTYYSYGSSNQYKLNGTTWETVSWSGYTTIYGNNVWTDGSNIYFSNSSDQYKLKYELYYTQKVNTSVSTIKKLIANEYTPLATQSNSRVSFDNLNPNYGYSIEYYSPTGSSNVQIPKWTNLAQENGTNNGTIKLTYTIKGGTNGTSQYVLRIKK